MHRFFGRRPFVLGVLTGLLVSMLGVVGSGSPILAAATPMSAPSESIQAMCPPARAGHKTCFGVRIAPSAPRKAPSRSGPGPLVVGGPAGGYAPVDIQSAYGMANAVGTNGTDQTIGIVDAYSDPAAAADLTTYRSKFNLAACALGSLTTSCLRIVNQAGGSTLPAADSGWASEITLDLDAASASCPLCHLVLVEANSAGDSDLATAIQTATSLGATVLSLSFGGCEAGGGESLFDPVLRTAHVPVAVASGDAGYYSADNPANPGCGPGTPSYPASSQYVTAVGGTSLMPSGTARGWSETAWSYVNLRDAGGGSGCSAVEPKPAWQTDSGCAGRTVADVSADADPVTGLAVYNSFSDVGWTYYGGTSLAAPIIAGLYALADSPPPALDGQVWYSDSTAVNDVVGGSNAPSSTDCPAAYLCNAMAGYDGPTGVGSPAGAPIQAAKLVPLTSPAPSTAVQVSWTLPQGAAATSYRLWVQDNTNGTGSWFADGTTTSTSIWFNGFRGHTYGFFLQDFLPNGWTSGPPVQAAVTTTIATNALMAMGYSGLYAVDGYGTLHPASSPPLATSAGWPGWNIARGLTMSPSGEGGVVLDGFGGLHSFGDSGGAAVTAYWSGWDIARAVSAVLPTNPGASSWTGYVLDGFGGLHGFAAGGGTAPSARASAYWSGWDIARSVATFSGGSGGLVLDGFGGLHPFAGGTNPMPAAATVTGYWPGWDIARSVVLLPGSTATSYSGFVLDGFGGLHPFKGGSATTFPSATTPAYWPNWDIARAVVLDPGSSTNGYVVDGYGGFHFFGTNPPATPLLTPNYGADAPTVRGAATG